MPNELPEIEKVEISVPFLSVQRLYPVVVANLIAKLRDSEAVEAKKHAPEDFRYFFAYTPVADPAGDLEQDEFVKRVLSKIKVNLRIRGYRFTKDAPLGSVPDNVRFRIEERARLICGSRVHAEAELPNASYAETETQPSSNDIDSAVETVQRSIDALVERFNGSIDPGYATIAKQALAMYKPKVK